MDTLIGWGVKVFCYHCIHKSAGKPQWHCNYLAFNFFNYSNVCTPPNKFRKAGFLLIQNILLQLMHILQIYNFLIKLENYCHRIFTLYYIFLTCDMLLRPKPHQIWHENSKVSNFELTGKLITSFHNLSILYKIPFKSFHQHLIG